MKSRLFIPNKINVGFRERPNTYTGKLAYVIYYDNAGKLRKETSWNSWRDKNIPNIEFDNIPLEGFVLNKGVGGVRQSYGWNARNEYIRIYDPRDFEFEISVANLLYILQHNNCNRGKGLEGQFVYSWDGTELLLLPVTTKEFKESYVFSKTVGNSIPLRDLQEGSTYLHRDGHELVYIGRRLLAYPFLNRHRLKRKSYYCNVTADKHYHMGIDPESRQFQAIKSKSDLVSLVTSEKRDDYAGFVDSFIDLSGDMTIARLEEIPVELSSVEWNNKNIFVKHEGEIYGPFIPNLHGGSFTSAYKIFPDLRHSSRLVEWGPPIPGYICHKCVKFDVIPQNPFEIVAVLDNGHKFSYEIQNWRPL